MREDCKAYLSVQRNAHAFAAGQGISFKPVNQVSKRPQKLKDKPKKGRGNPKQPKPHSNSRPKDPPSPCRRCNRNHWNDECPVPEDVACSSCKKTGHNHYACKAKHAAAGHGEVGKAKKSAHAVDILTITTPREINFISVPLNIDGKQTHLVADTGAKLTIISKGSWAKLGLLNSKILK